MQLHGERLNSLSDLIYFIAAGVVKDQTLGEEYCLVYKAYGEKPASKKVERC